MFPISAMSGHVRRPGRFLAVCCTLAASSLAPPSLPQEEPIDSPIIEREEVQFISTASGDYTIEEMTVRDGSAFSTASGDIELRNVELEAGGEVLHRLR